MVSNPFLKLSSVSPGKPTISSVYVGILFSRKIFVRSENLLNLIFARLIFCNVVGSSDSTDNETPPIIPPSLNSFAIGRIFSLVFFAHATPNFVGNFFSNASSFNF